VLVSPEVLQERLEAAVDRLCASDERSREQAVEAVLCDLAGHLAGDGGSLVAEDVVAAARETCRHDVRMLGPLFEALATREERHQQGQFFTPAPIAAQMAAIVDQARPETVLDPAVGAGILLASCSTPARLLGLDTSPVCAALARTGLAARGAADADIRVGDFLASGAEVPSGPVDAVIANPPYQRHHLLDRAAKGEMVRRYSRQSGQRISSLSSTYVYFLLEAIDRVREDGIVVFLTPADFLDARFGEAVRRVLRDRVTLDEILLFDRSELAFDDVLTTSAITVLRKRPPASHHHIRFVEGDTANEVERADLDPVRNWSLQFGHRRAEFEELTRGRTRTLSDYLRVRRGIATGANGFFLIDRETRDRWQLPDRFLSPVVASARDLPDGVLRTEDWERLRDAGRPSWLLDCDVPAEQLDHDGLREYIAEGERQGVHRRFNCRSRTPWYRVERVPPADVIVTYMQRGRARFVRNDAGCRLMSVFLNGFVLDGDVDELLAVLNSDETARLIRAVSRTYGGGLVKIEPRALASLPMPVI
jgi:adenine-specific DNA-methyltransferase